MPQNRERRATERPALCLHRKGQIRNDVRGRTNPLSRRVKLSTVRRRALEGVRPRYTYVLVPAQESYGFIGSAKATFLTERFARVMFAGVASGARRLRQERDRSDAGIDPTEGGVW